MMEELKFVNNINKEVYYLKWKASDEKGSVVISHGMAEHIERYDDLANYLNENGYTVYGINQIGHGYHAEKLGHMGKNDFDQCVTNVDMLVQIAKKETNKKVYLLGHSMGSFVAQLYPERYHNIDGLILSGSNHSNAIVKIGSFVASVANAFAKDKSAPSEFMNNMSFGGYGKYFPDRKTDFDWLNRDEKEVQKYIDDPQCGYVCSSYFFKNLTHGLAIMNKNSNMKKIDKNMPIYIEGGTMDPVSDCGKGLNKLYAHYQKLGIKDVKITLYEGARHEIFNEINKKEVYQNTLDWLNAHN